jgi:uncharacterized phage protein (predicted DNA packaging)
VLNEIKLALRVTHSAFDTDVLELIEEARADLMLSGISSVKAEDDTDPLIKRAVKTYCKANFGFDNPDAERLQQSYEMIKQHLSLAGDYKKVEQT